jgi:aminotransferase
MLDRVNHQVLSFTKSGIRRFAEAAMAREDVVSLTIGEPEFNTDDAIKAALVDALNANYTHYPVGQGVFELRQAIAEFEAKQNVMGYDAHEIIVTNGSTQGLAAVFLSLLNEGDEVIIPEPMFISYRPVVEFAKAKVVPLVTEAHNFQIDERALEALVTSKTKMIVITSPNNPTGVVYSQASVDAIAYVAKKYRLFIVSDDVYHQLVYLKEFPRLSLDASLRSQLIIAQSFSKPYAMTGWRVGYVMADRPLIDHISKWHNFLVGGISHFSQMACIEALKTDVAKTRSIYAHRRDWVLAHLDKMGLTYVRPEGAFYVFVNIREFQLDSERFCEKALNDYRVAIVPGVYFGDHSDHYIRISYAVSEVDLSEGLARLETMIHDLRKT